jgi:hypothetical protein
MRDFLTYVGIGLILVLAAMLGAPYVVDFDAHRARFSEEISRATGAQAHIGGPIEFRMLPTPYFSAQNLSLTGALGALKAEKADFELSLPSLLQGEMSFTHAELSKFVLDLDGDQLRRPKTSAARFDNLVLRDGRLRVLHAGKPFLALEKVDFDGRVQSLEGPYDARGEFRVNERVIRYTVSTDRFSGARLPVKMRFDGPADLGHLTLDGALDLSGKLAFAGKGAAEGALALKGAPEGAGNWQVEGDVSAQPEAVKLEKALLRLGEGAQAARFSGGADYGVANGALAVDFSAPHLDGPWADIFAGAVKRAMDRAAPTALRAQIDALDWRGDWTRVKLARDPGGPLKMSAEGQGGARIEATAAPDGKAWRGKGEFSASDYATFAAATEATPLPFRQVAAGGNFSFSPGALTVTGGQFGLDRAKFAGDVAWTAPTKGFRAKFAATLTGTNLDPAAAADYGAALGDSDLDLTLDAQTAKAEGKLSLRLLREKGVSRLEKFEAKSLAGADVSAAGEWKDRFSSPKGFVRLKAGELHEFASLLARLAPSETTRLLASRAKILSPAAFNGKADNGAFAFDGQADATKFSASLDEKGSVALDVSAPEAFDLLAQLGAPPLLSPQKLGPGQISLKTQEQAGRRDVTGRAALGKINGELAGALRDGALEGMLSLSGDPSSLIGGPAGPGKIAGQIEAREGRVLLRKIVGERGDARFSGQLSVSANGVSGDLDVDKFSAPGFVSVILGPTAPTKPGAVWPSLSFAPVLIDPPRTKLSIRAAEVAPFGVPANFDLMLAPNALSVANIDATFSGGKLRGGFDLRRQAGQATLSGEFFGEGFALKNPALSAKAGGRLKFSASGANMAALVGALSGTGSAKVTEAVVAGAAPEAPDQVLAAQAGTEKPFSASQTVRELDLALAKGDLRLGDGETPLRLAKGEVKAARDGVAFTYDLDSLTFELASALPNGRDDLTWSGAWSSPSRKVNATTFVSIAATKALEREQARIAQQRELDRQRKAELERQRAERERQKQEEAERRKQEEAAKKAALEQQKLEEIERRKQEQAQKQQPQPTPPATPAAPAPQ